MLLLGHVCFVTQHVFFKELFMKIALILLSFVTITANLFAASFIQPSDGTSASSANISGGMGKLQAAIILNDAQQLIQTGKVSILLAQKIKDVQATNTEISESEALEIVVVRAEEILK
jgi:hypothetical protein